ncbi:GntR family transcriptional regulator [Pseudonocardia spinosispora]|uniref:GntR family transcriptional regulator n=1 Tax=Pseudonocardia spinosispora TaxID=103441 RepID=UPI0004203D18|nr:GntR family transcriptional regulator [Pseudonocardia spinosispora]
MSRLADTRADTVQAYVEQLCLDRGPGALLPGERELAAHCGVSRMTVRTALEQLMARRLIERRHGAGTFVRRPTPAQPLMATSFREDMRRRGMTASSRLLWWDTVVADTELADRLEMPGGERALRVCRLRLADDEPMTLETLHAPCSRVPGLTGHDLDGEASYYDVLATRFDRHVAQGTQSVAPVVLERRDAELLGVPAGRPALRFVRTSRDQRGEVIERVESLARGDRYLIEMDIIPPAGALR